MNFEILRKIAETASGMRETDLWFVVKDEKFTWQLSEPRDAPEGAVVIPVAKTPDPGPLVTEARISDAAGPGINLMEVKVPARGPYPGGTYPADAVFWSVSAVEKFLLPYYASVYGDQAPEAVATVLAILRPPADGARLEPAPYAIAHLPSSEYVGMSSPADAGGGGRQFYESVFLLRGDHAEPLSWHFRNAGDGSATAAAPQHGAPAAAAEPRGERQPAGESPRTNGSRRKYALSAGR